jgi:hypothetical protein
MLPFVTNSALGGGVQVAAFVQDRTQQQGGGWLGQHLPNSRSSCSIMTLPSRAANVKASATACGLLVFASACCPPRPRSGRLQVTMHSRALQRTLGLLLSTSTLLGNCVADACVAVSMPYLHWSVCCTLATANLL